jgi:hypothetical protein
MFHIVASLIGNNTNRLLSSSRSGSIGCCDFTAGDVAADADADADTDAADCGSLLMISDMNNNNNNNEVNK